MELNPVFTTRKYGAIMREIGGTAYVAGGFSIDLQAPDHDVPMTLNYDLRHPIGVAHVTRAENGDLMVVAKLVDDPVLHMKLFGKFPCLGVQAKVDNSEDPKNGTVISVAATPHHPGVVQPFWEVIEDESGT